MNPPEIPRRFILADVDLKANALQVYLLARCRHILRHEAANAVQGIHSGVSFIAKITDSPSRSPVSMTECISMLRHQVSGLQETLFSVFDYVSPPAGLAEALNVREVLSEVRRLLTSEAGTVNFDIDLAEDRRGPGPRPFAQERVAGLAAGCDGCCRVRRRGGPHGTPRRWPDRVSLHIECGDLRSRFASGTGKFARCG